MKELVKYGLRNPVQIKVRKDQEKEQKYSIPENLKNQYLVFADRYSKIVFLFTYLRKFKDKKVLVFFNTCKSVDFYSNLLESYLNMKLMKMALMKISRVRYST